MDAPSSRRGPFLLLVDIQFRIPPLDRPRFPTTDFSTARSSPRSGKAKSGLLNCNREACCGRWHQALVVFYLFGYNNSDRYNSSSNYQQGLIQEAKMSYKAAHPLPEPASDDAFVKITAFGTCTLTCPASYAIDGLSGTLLCNSWRFLIQHEPSNTKLWFDFGVSSVRVCLYQLAR